MTTSQAARNVVVLAAVVAVYSIAGKLGLRFAFVNPSASAVWAPTGIALAALLLLGYRVWPAILAGAFLVNVTTAGSVATSSAIAVGNTLEGLLGAYLVNRFAGGRNPFDRVHHVFTFAALAGIAAPIVSATCGVTALAVAAFAGWSEYWSIWWTWWLGDAAGALIVTPFALLWGANPRLRWTRRQGAEATRLSLGLVVVCGAVFSGMLPAAASEYPLEYFCVPFWIWAAFRFGAREAATVVALSSVIAIFGTLHGFGPFAGATENASLLPLQAFFAVGSIMTLVLAAVVAERNRAEEALRHLAVTDPLTGLANYRSLIGALEAEIRRARRAERTFAVLFFDLDGLKEINDRRGHVAGSRALCRVADALRLWSRAIDTPARYGGDEFAVILGETGEDAARAVARRIAEHVAADTEQPSLSVSFGVSVFPRDGETAETLLDAADRALYGARGGDAGRSKLTTTSPRVR